MFKLIKREFWNCSLERVQESKTHPTGEGMESLVMTSPTLVPNKEATEARRSGGERMGRSFAAALKYHCLYRFWT